MSANRKNNIAVLIIYLVGYVAFFGVQAFFANQLGLEDYGDISVALSVANLLAALTLFGFADSAGKFVPQLSVKKSFDTVKGFIITAVSGIIIFGTVVSLVSAGILEILHQTVNFEDHPIMMAIPLIIPMAGFIFCENLLSTQKQSFKGALIGQLIFPLLLLAMAFLLLYFSRDQSVIEAHLLTEAMALESHIFSRLLVIVLYAYFILKFWKRYYGQDKPQFHIKKWLATSSNFFFAFVPTVAIITSSMLLLENLQPHEDDVGIFSAALVVAKFSMMFLYAVRVFSIAELSVALNNRDITQTTNILRVNLRMLAGIGLSVVVILWVGGRWIMGWFAIEGDESYFVIGTLGVAHFFALMGGLTTNVLQLSGMHKYTIMTSFAILLLNILFACLLIPAFAAEGAALAMLLSYAIPNCYIFYVLSKKLGIPYIECIFTKKLATDSTGN